VLPERPELNGTAKPRHLDPTALVTPSLALANAARETLRMGDLIDNMLDAMLDVLHGKQTAITQEMRRLTDDVEALYSAIKLYLAQMPREDLGDQDSRRWAEIIELAINLKLASDLIERMLRKIQQQKTSQRRSFSEVGLEDLAGLHQQLIANLRLGLSVFLSATGKVPGSCYARNVAFAHRNAAWPMRMSAVCNARSCRVSRPVRCIWS
jgi:phosphate:Na+ symporter